MPDDPLAILNLAAVVASFLLVLSLWIAGIMVWVTRRKSRAKKVEQRLQIDQVEKEERKTLHLWRHGERASTTVRVAGDRLTFRGRLDAYAHRAGWEFGAVSFAILAGGTILIVAAFAALVMNNILLGFSVAGGMVIVLHLYTAGRIQRLEARFERQLVDAMELASRSLRAGHPLLGAFQLIAEEMSVPIRTVFAEICQRHEMGISIAESLRDTAETATNTDMKMFATSVTIQMRTGGNLADLMDRLAKVVHERMRLNRRVRVLTAQTQMSKRVLLALPFLTFIALNLLNPAYMSPLYKTMTGQILLAIAAAGLAVGALLINRMAVLKY